MLGKRLSLGCKVTTRHHEPHVDACVDHRAVEIPHYGLADRVVPLLALDDNHLINLTQNDIDAMITRGARPLYRIPLPLEDVGHEVFEICPGHGTQSLQ